MKEAVALAALVLAGISLQVGESIHCWECNSKYDPNCADPFQPYTLATSDCNQRYLKQNASIPATICRKLTQTVRGETRIVRSCGYLEPESSGTCISRAGTHMVFVEYCQCDGDGCNQAGPLPASSALIALLVSFLTIAGSLLS